LIIYVLVLIVQLLRGNRFLSICLVRKTFNAKDRSETVYQYKHDFIAYLNPKEIKRS